MINNGINIFYNDRVVGQPIRVLWCSDENVDVTQIKDIKTFENNYRSSLPYLSKYHWEFGYSDKDEKHQFISGTPKIDCVKGHFYKTIYSSYFDAYDGEMFKFYAVIEYDSESREEFKASLKKGMINILEGKLKALEIILEKGE